MDLKKLEKLFKRLLKLLKLNKLNKQSFKKCNVFGINDMIEHKTFNERGEFIKSSDFEKIWLDEKDQKNPFLRAINVLNDDEYLDYKIWYDMNNEMLYKKHFPNKIVILGNNPNIIFHGGCLGCLSQRIHGLERCKGCCYFRSGTGKINLHIKGEEADTISWNELRSLLELE